jgi:glycogen phosphorylase
MTDVDQTPSDGMSPSPTRADLVEHSRTGMSAAALQRAINDHLRYSIGRPAAARRPEHYYRALALAVTAFRTAGWPRRRPHSISAAR